MTSRHDFTYGLVPTETLSLSYEGHEYYVENDLIKENGKN